MGDNMGVAQSNVTRIFSLCLLLSMNFFGNLIAVSSKSILIPLEYGQFQPTKMVSSSSSSFSIHRNLLGESRMWLYGHILTRGYYYTNLWIGTPPQRFSLIVDTGSTVTYVPCSTCTKCGAHQDSPFTPSNSSTYQSVRCRSSDCPGQSCDNLQRCLYQRHYAEDSSSSGLLVSDVVGLGDGASSIGTPRFRFGCETLETGELYTQRADGIVGLGRGELSIVDQLFAEKKIKNVFSLCYGGMDLGGGGMVMGETELPAGVVWTPMDPARMSVSSYYNLIIEDFRVNGKSLDLPSYLFEQGYGSVLDSGTTFTYLPKPVYNAVIAEIKSNLKKLHPEAGPDPKYSDTCYGGASLDGDSLKDYFPQVDIVFGGGAVYKLSPENYLFRHTKVEGAYCLGIFQHSDAGTLLGAILVRNTLITYDRENNRVGFLKTNCDKIFDTLPTNKTKPSQSNHTTKSEAAAPTPSEAPVSKTWNGTDLDPGCNNGCSTSVLVVIHLQKEFDAFRKLIPEFLDDLVAELDVHHSQLEVLKFTESKPSGVEVQFNVLPLPPLEHIPSGLTKHITEVLKGNNSGLRDDFGDVHVASIKIVPVRAVSEFPLWTWILVGSLVVIVTGSVTVLGFFWFIMKENPFYYFSSWQAVVDEEEKIELSRGNQFNSEL